MEPERRRYSACERSYSAWRQNAPAIWRPAPTLEELQHEAREALIEHLGPAHCTVRVGVRRGPSAAVSSIRPVVRPGALCR
jgi:hypothetical protein